MPQNCQQTMNLPHSWLNKACFTPMLNPGSSKRYTKMRMKKNVKLQNFKYKENEKITSEK